MVTSLKGRRVRSQKGLLATIFIDARQCCCGGATVTLIGFAVMSLSAYIATYILIYIYKYISRITYFDDPGDLFEMSLKIIH